MIFFVRSCARSQKLLYYYKRETTIQIDLNVYVKDLHVLIIGDPSILSDQFIFIINFSIYMQYVSGI